MITEGLHQLSALEYQADPCPVPSLSASIAHILISQSPRHAWFAHPRLNPAYEREEEGKFDLGTAAHAYMLEGETGFVVVEARDWKTNAAKDARVQARLAGKIPILAEKWADVKAMVAAAGPQLDGHQDPPQPLRAGKPEVVLVWREGDVWCRARLDWLHDSGTVIDDYKTTAATANPDVWTRMLFNMGFDLQAAFYLRGLRKVAGVGATFRFVVQENFAPYALSVLGVGPDVLTLAEKKREYAVNLWQECSAANRWPGYPTRTCWLQVPAWEETRWLERTLRGTPPPAEDPIDDGRPLDEQLFGEEAR